MIESLKTLLAKRLPLLGHRNWIVIADMAYPQQSNPGIETHHIGGGHLEAIREALALIEQAPHVRPVIHVDAELDHVAELNAPGVGEFREELEELAADFETRRLPHEEIIYKLDEAAKTFNILLLKTDFTIPYTTVFLQLECGYWTPEAEAELRQSFAGK